MTNTQHTPGPWQVDATVYRHAPQIVSEGGSFIANTHSHNARLIATAPELLAALQALDWAVTGFADFEAQYPEEIAAARAAIAKATGQ